MKKVVILLAIALVVVFVILVVQSTQKGMLRVDSAGVTIELGGGWGRGVRIGPDSEPVQVFTGVYAPKKISVFAEKDGKKATLSGYGPWGSIDRIPVRKDQTTTITAGPPITLKPAIRKMGRDVSIGLSIVGKAGEHYRPDSGNAPKLKIVDEAGNVLSSGQFKFG